MNDNTTIEDAVQEEKSSNTGSKIPARYSIRAAAGMADVATTNHIYREKHTEKPSKCAAKFVVNSRLYGTRGTGGSLLAKSAIRLAIDTGVKSPSTFERSSLRSLPRIKPIIWNDLEPQEAVDELDTFEKKYGGKISEAYKNKMLAYRREKQSALREIGIATNSQGQPLFKDEVSQTSYYNKLKDLSFQYYEIYLSVTPKDGRATRSKSFRVMNLDELKAFFPDYTFEKVE